MSHADGQLDAFTLPCGEAGHTTVMQLPRPTRPPNYGRQCHCCHPARCNMNNAGRAPALGQATPCGVPLLAPLSPLMWVRHTSCRLPTYDTTHAALLKDRHMAAAHPPLVAPDPGLPCPANAAPVLLRRQPWAVRKAPVHLAHVELSQGPAQSAMPPQAETSPCTPSVRGRRKPSSRPHA